MEISPGFIEDEYADDPRLNIFRYMRYINFSGRLQSQLYSRTEDYHASMGMVVLVGTLKLIDVADYVFRSDNHVRQGFDTDREENTMYDMNVAHNHVFYFDTFLETALMHF